MRISNSVFQLLAVQFNLFNFSVFNAKEVLYTGTELQETDEVKKLYAKTHGITDPGQQKNRNYNWNFDKYNHVYGKPEFIEFDGAKKSLSSDFLDANYPKTKIIDKRLEDFRQATSDMLGKSKFKGSLGKHVDENTIFGKKTIVGDNWNVGKCINGDLESRTSKHLEADVDLGKSLHYRSKLEILKPKNCNTVNSDKQFGIPSIRYDLNKSEKTSMANLNVKIFLK